MTEKVDKYQIAIEKWVEYELHYHKGALDQVLGCA